MQKSLETGKNLLGNETFIDFSVFFLITILTPSLLFFGLFGDNPTNWWQSISAAYYCNTKGIFVSIMALLAFILLLAKKPLYMLSSISVIGILLFPTYEEPLNISLDSLVGIFNIPLQISGTLHVIFNFILLIFIVMIVVKTALEYRKNSILYLLLPIALSVLAIIIETILHTNGNWSFHWSTIFSEWLLFQSVGLVFFIRGKLLGL